MKFQLLHRAVKGTPVVSLNTVMCAIHIRILARQIHNARILPTAAATRPARLRRSLPAATLLFSIPTAPCVTMVTGVRMYVFPANLMMVDARIRRRRPRPQQWAGRLRPWADVDPAPPTITRIITSFATEVSPAWTPNALSLLSHQICYILMTMWIRGACLDSSSLIDWLWIWWMDFVAPSLFE
jgi:hypothetical protein